MRVQLSEKSKAEFIELITEDSITCWFEGNEFVMPSGQGKTAKGIVLGKLLVWQHQQSKVDEMTKQSIEQGQRFNEQSQIVKDLEHKNAELQKRLDALEKSEFKLAQIKSILQNNPKLLESTLVKKLERALKGDYA